MEVKVNFEVYDGAAKNERHNPTEPNQALQRIDALVTDHAPSSMLRAACSAPSASIAELKRSADLFGTWIGSARIKKILGVGLLYI